MNKKVLSIVIWAAVVFLAVLGFAKLTIDRGETVNALWFVVAAVCIYSIAYRFYAKYIAQKVLGLDDNRATPAVVKNDGRDFVPTNKIVLFGHHFAAIAGAGPLVGPILAAQMGYLPGMIWLVVGVVIAGAVHDFVVLWLSTRRDGKSLGEMIKLELGKGVGTVAMIGILGIMMLIVAILALVVVNALAESPWGLFTIAMTLPIAIVMGIWMRFIRPGRIGEASIFGFIMLMLALWGGHYVAADPYWADVFTISPVNLAFITIGYGFVAAILPVWLLLAPRDYLSTFLKIGVIFAMALVIVYLGIGDFAGNQNIQVAMPMVTKFTDGTGPVFAGKLFPFLFITIACGAISGFHSTQSPMIARCITDEKYARPIFYGAMITEGIIALMWATLGICFYENSAELMNTVKSSGAGGVVAEISKGLLGKTGSILTISSVVILAITTGDTCFRSARLSCADFFKVSQNKLVPRVILTALVLSGGVVLSIINIETIWQYFGWANQTLAMTTLWLTTIYLYKSQKFYWISLIPAIFMTAVCTTYIAYDKLFFNLPVKISSTIGWIFSLFCAIAFFYIQRNKKGKAK
jgi:carbon starvation protein